MRGIKDRRTNVKISNSGRRGGVPLIATPANVKVSSSNVRIVDDTPTTRTTTTAVRAGRASLGPAPQPKRGATTTNRAVASHELLHPLIPEKSEYELDVSVVFGTYNRRKLLQGCVESIHKACAGLSYEIVISDGGSTDGSGDWLRQQPNVVVLAGDLSGAVKAFNDAARVARGRYIVCLNDDAELEESAIRNALAYFKDPLVGQVAMSFLERGSWRILDALGKTYGNFPVTRAAIVRAVEHLVGGMWATCYRTYGGDNELSCWVYRLGYKIVGAADARVRHHEHLDELRRSNSSSDTARSQFHVRWPSGDRLAFRGPLPALTSAELARLAKIESGTSLTARWERIPPSPSRGEDQPTSSFGRERVLHWHLRTDDDPQTSLVDALAAIATDGYTKVDWTFTKESERGIAFASAVSRLRPTLIFMQLQDPAAVPVSALRTLREAKTNDPSLVVCTWSGDVGPGKGPWPGMKDDWQYEIAKSVDLMLFTGTGQVEMHRHRGMANAAYLQIGYDTDRYYPGPDENYGKKHAVVFIGQDYGNRFDSVPDHEAGLRRSMVQAMRKNIPGFVAYGGGFGNSLPQNQVGNIYRSSNAAISISLTSRLGRYTSDRMIRSMASGCPTFVKRFEDMEGMGLVDGVNCIAWSTVEELLEKSRTWLAPSHRGALRDVGRAGATLMKTKHTWSYRMQELAAIVDAVRGHGQG